MKKEPLLTALLLTGFISQSAAFPAVPELYKHKNIFYQEEKLTTNDFINEIIMLGLRTKNGFSLETVFKNTNADNKSRLIEKIKELIYKKLTIHTWKALNTRKVGAWNYHKKS